MKPNLKIRLGLSLLLGVALLPFHLDAAKGGKGKPGGGGDGDLPLTDPAIVYSADVSGSARGLVMSDAEGSIKKTLYTGENIGYPQFVPESDGIVFNSNEYHDGGGSSLGRLLLLTFAVDPVLGVTVGQEFELDQVADGFFSGIDVDENGQWVLYNPSQGPQNTLKLLSLISGDPPVDVVFPSYINHIWNAVWLENQAFLAVSYSPEGQNPDEVAVFNFDPNDPSGLSQVDGHFVIPEDDTRKTSGVVRIEKLVGSDGVAFKYTIDTEETVKYKGRTRRILKDVVYKLVFDFADIANSQLEPLGPSGVEVQGANPAFSPDGSFITTSGEEGGIWRTALADGSEILIETNRASQSDWNPDWVAP